jgi:hypothetical protein
MSHSRNQLIVGSRHVSIGEEQGSAVTAANEPPPPRPRDRLPSIPPPGEPPIGREPELADLPMMITPGEPVQICGPDGIGKTTLLRQLAHDLAAEGKPVIYLHGAGRELDDILQDIFEACYESSGYAPSRIRLRGLLADVSATVLVDDLQCPAGQLREFFEPGPGIALVFTATARQDAVTQAIELDGLNQAAASSLLARDLGRQLRNDELPVAALLWQTTHGVPAELIRAAAAAVTQDGSLTSLPASGPLAPLLYSRLSDTERSVLAIFAAFPTAQITPDLLTHATTLPDAHQTSDHLAQLGFLTAEEPPGGEHRYRLAAGIDGQLPQHAALTAAGVEDLAQRMTAWASSPQGRASVGAHIDLLSALCHTAAATQPALASQLARAAAPAAARSLRWGGWRRLLKAGLSAAEQAGDKQAMAYFQHELGISLLAVAAPGAAAALAAAAALWAELGNTAGAAITMHAQTALASPTAVPVPAAAQGTAIPAATPAAAPAVPAASTASSVTAGTMMAAGKAVIIKTIVVATGVCAVGGGVTYGVTNLVQAAKPSSQSIGCAQISPGRVDFPQTLSSAESSITITNTCAKPASVVLSVPSQPVTIVRNGCGTGQLAPRQSCQARLRFTPASPGPATSSLEVRAGQSTGHIPLAANAELPALQGSFAVTGYTMSCPDSTSTAICAQIEQTVKDKLLASLPPLVIQADPHCTAQPCNYRLTDPSAPPSTGPFTVTPDNGGYVISDQQIRAEFNQVFQALGTAPPDISSMHIRLDPTSQNQGIVTQSDLKASITSGGQTLTETFTLTRTPATPSSATPSP